MGPHLLHLLFLPILGFFTLFATTGINGSIEVHFEEKDSAFFLKEANSKEQEWRKSSLEYGALYANDETLAYDRFTVSQIGHAASVEATYGPFATKQTVPSRYVVPDIDNNNNTISTHDDYPLDVTPQLVQNEIHRDRPILRVLFHTKLEPVTRIKNAHNQPVCITLQVSPPNQFQSSPPLTATCRPSNDNAVCLAQVTIPASWWAPMSVSQYSKPHKSPPRLVTVSYAVLEPLTSTSSSSSSNSCLARIQIQPLTPVASIPLTQAHSTYKEIKLDDSLIFLIPQAAVYPQSRIHVPIYLRITPDRTFTGFIVKGRVKSGLRILDAHSSIEEKIGNLTFTSNTKNTMATVTFMYKSVTNNNNNNIAISDKVEEVMTWLLQVDDEDINGADGRIVWSVQYLVPQRSNRKKISTRFQIHKDDTQAVLPMSKSWEIINTAVLTARQVSQPLKIFTVSHSGKIADVTRQSTCQTEDENVLKVTSSCSSVYTDGSETRGSCNATILVKYETFNGLARYIVWLPEINELDISLSDSKLSQIDQWFVLNDSRTRSTRTAQRAKDKRWIGRKMKENLEIMAKDKFAKLSNKKCRLRYQQTTVEVYARFKATDHESGRVSYLISRKTWLKITDLVRNLMVLSDSYVATLKGHVILGRNAGSTDIQIVSAFNGRVIASRGIRVVNDKVSITKLKISIVTGLQLNVIPDSSIENGYIAHTSVTRALSARYQEGLLDIDVEFSDESQMCMQDVETKDYMISVESLNADVVAFAPMVTSSHPRVIAVGEGEGELLRISLVLTPACQPVDAPAVLISRLAYLRVNFTNDDQQHRPELLQNDAGAVSNVGKDKKGTSNLHDILMAVGDYNNEQSQQHSHKPTKDDDSLRRWRKPTTTTLSLFPPFTGTEIALYLILATVSLSIIAFLVFCMIYASKHKKHHTVNNTARHSKSLFSLAKYTLLGEKNSNNGKGTTDEPTTNVHDWVWLGRATVERTSGALVPSITANATRRDNNSMKITANATYEYGFEQGSCFDNPNHIELPSSSSLVDSTTYCKKDKKQLRPCTKGEYKPPVPPHRNLPVSENAPPSVHHRHHHHHRHRHHVKEMQAQGQAKPIDTLPLQHMNCQSHNNNNNNINNNNNQANIINNALFRFSPQHDEENVNGTAMDQLNLKMDYQQIMNYFDNLKESTA